MMIPSRLIGAIASLAAAATLCARGATVGPSRVDAPPSPPIAAAGDSVGPSPLRAIYVNRWAVVDSTRLWPLVDIAKRTEVNALVIDVKDDRGYVLYPSTVPLARSIGADTTQPFPRARLAALMDSLRKYDIYPIARIVVAKDPLLAERRSKWAIRRRSDMAPWLDPDGRPWLDATHPEIWKYAADLAAEAVKLGFREIQLDYVRFPDDPNVRAEGVFPLMRGRSRAGVIHDQLAYARSLIHPLGVPLTIDVFGLTTTDTSDMGIGQKWELFAPEVDGVQPMTYPSHYSAGLYGLDNPNAHPYDVIARAMKDALARNAPLAHPPRIVPWYQDFDLGTPSYGVEQIRAQMQAGYDAGIASWMLWNPGSQYTVAALRPKPPSP